MKKVLYILCAVLCLAVVFTGCSKEPEPLRILVDADAREFANDSCAGSVSDFLSSVAEQGGPTDVEVEVLPDSGNEREVALERIRTEIMAGRGPDLFIIRCYRGLNARDLMFPIPEKAMANGLFLPLDEYIENAQFMEWEKNTKVIMDAGRDEYGQQMIPLTYTMPLTFYRTEDIPGVKPEKDTTWQDMLSDESGVLTTAATWRHYGLTEYRFMDSEDNYIEYILGDFADFKSDTLLFTEEELLTRVTELIETDKAYAAGEIPEAPAHYQTRMHVGYDRGPQTGYYSTLDIRDLSPESYRGIKYNDVQTMIPIYSDDGGVTATVSSFAAINANTKRAEDAFFILDLFLSRYWQQRHPLYTLFFSRGQAGVPVYEDLMRLECPIEYMEYTGSIPYTFYLTNENYAEYSRVREQITRVYFQGDCTDIFDDMYWECRSAYDRGEDLMPIVEEYYTQLKILMAE